LYEPKGALLIAKLMLGRCVCACMCWERQLHKLAV
jgi:hypothetical protein